MWKVPSSAWRIELAGSCLFQVVPSACVVWNIHQPHVLHIFTSQGITGRQDKRCSKLQGTVRWMTLLQGIRSGTALAAPMRRPRVSWRQHLKQLVWVVVSNIFLFSPLFGEDSHFAEYFFRWVETPTSGVFFSGLYCVFVDIYPGKSRNPC